MHTAQIEKELGTESRIGWDATFVFVGEIARIRAPGFGHGCRAKITKLGATGYGSLCEVEIVKVGKTAAGWKVGNLVDVCAAWIEGVRM